MIQLDSIRFRMKIFDSLAMSFGFLSAINLVLLGIIPFGHQVLFWLEHDVWLNKDFITYLRYLEISPYTDMKGLNRIIEWIVSTHVFVFSLILTLVLALIGGYFAGLSGELERAIILRSESENEDIAPKNVPAFGLDKIYSLFRKISDQPIWSVLDRVWSYFFGFIFYGFLILLVFTLVVALWVNP